MIRALKETLASSKALCLSLGHMTKFTQPQPCLAWELLPPPRGVNPAWHRRPLPSRVVNFLQGLCLALLDSKGSSLLCPEHQCGCDLRYLLTSVPGAQDTGAPLSLGL